MRRTGSFALWFAVTACGLDVVGSSASPGTPTPTEEGEEPGAPPPAGGPDAARTDAATGTLVWTREDITKDIDLTAEGGIDWVHWGHESARNEKKDPELDAIGELRFFPLNHVPEYEGNSTTAFTWTDGSPVQGVTTRRYLYLNGAGAEPLAITVPIQATSTVRTANVYLGGKGSLARYEAALTDGSAPSPEPIDIDESGPFLHRLRIDFAAASADAKLEVKVTRRDPRTTDASVRIAAVTLD